MARISGLRVWAIVTFGMLAIGGLAVAGAVMLPEADPEQAASARPAQPVRASRIVFAPQSRVATFTGMLRPRHEAAVGFRVAGKIVTRAVEVGDHVRRGEVMAELDNTDARLQAELAAAEDEAARVDLRRAQADAQRSQTLFAAGHLAKASLERALSAEAEATARKDRAGRNLALAQNALAYTRLTADADGWITSTPAEVGQVLGAGSPVVSVAADRGADVVFAVPETDRALFDTGKAWGVIWGDEARKHRLTLRDISPDVDPQGRTYRVRMTIDLPLEKAGFGRTVTVTLDAGHGPEIAKVPLAAVLNDGAGPGLWRIAGDRVMRVPVELVSVTLEGAAIRGAFQAGDLIISLGAHKVDPSRPVRIVETTDAVGG